MSANPIQTDLAQVSLISEVDSIKPGASFWVALRWQMRPKWHIYWQNPGDSGVRPTLRWQLPEGWTASDIFFPTPQRFIIPPLPLANFGYENDIYLPVEIQPAPKAEGTVTLKVRADWLICGQECIPESGELSLVLPIGDGKVSPARQRLFQQIRQTLPQPVSKPIGLEVNDRELLLDLGAVPELEVRPNSQVIFFPFQDGVIVNSAEQKLEFINNRPILRLQRGYRTEVEDVAGVIAMGAGRSWRVQASPLPVVGREPNPPRETTGFGEAIGLALLGGLVLNLMPCVLPILSLRALAITALSQHSPRRARLSGLAFTSGVLVCFGGLGLALILLRSLGQSIGWGFQLQSPVVVLTLAYLLFAVGLNLSGVFVVGGGLTGIGQNLASSPGLAGEFFTGVLAVLMSTPCTAPFMATAVGAALVLPELQSLLILLALGLGFACPYLFLCLVPRLHRLLPKAGTWLEILPQVLAFPIYGTAGWLLWVFTKQTGTEGLGIALVGFVLIGFAGWLYGKTQMARSCWRRVGLIGTGIAIALCLGLLPVVNAPSVPVVWQTYSPAKLADLRAQGRPVFVSFTAAWCVSCLINERTTLSQPEVLAEFQRRGVILLKADWTNQDPIIAEQLQQFGSSGVPLYLLYGSKMKEGKPLVLPKNLTPQIVQSALEQVVPLF